MGNSNSQPIEDTYNDYLTKQQKIIMAQQEQINKLSKMNLRQNILNNQHQQTPPNILFQKHQPQPQINNQQNQQQFQIENKKKINPYTILNITKDYDETILKKAYLRMAIKTHPDKGGNVDDFQKVSIAYTLLLKKLNDQKNNHVHNELRDNSETYMNDQSGVRNVKLNDNFDSNLFNKIYEENRLGNVYDDGYGGWMKSDTMGNTQQKKMFNGNFNHDMFNNEFNKYKRKQVSMGNKIVKYNEPSNDISYKGKDSIMSLGQDKITNFSGECPSGLNYRDYKDAFSNPYLINTDDVNIRGRARNINDIEVQRDNIQYTMSEEDIKMEQLKKLKEEQNETLRIQRLTNNDNIAFNTYDRIHQRMVGN